MFTYDKSADALEILVSNAIVARTEQIDEGTLVDLDAHGLIVAIEVLRPAREWPLKEVMDRFHLEQSSADMLRALWDGQKSYPFADSTDFAAESTTSEELIPA